MGCTLQQDGDANPCLFEGKIKKCKPAKLVFIKIPPLISITVSPCILPQECQVTAPELFSTFPFPLPDPEAGGRILAQTAVLHSRVRGCQTEILDSIRYAVPWRYFYKRLSELWNKPMTDPGIIGQ